MSHYGLGVVGFPVPSTDWIAPLRSDASADITRAFERKVRLTRLAMLAEQIWRRLWLVFGVAGLFLASALVGVWEHVGDTAHMGLLAALGGALAVTLLYAIAVVWPSRADAIRRIEAISGVPHRPASSYEDTLTASADDPSTRAIWTAHRKRMAAEMGRLKPGQPEPRTDRFDPLAVRALAVLGLVLATALTGPALYGRLLSAFDLTSKSRLAEARLDAWITPPAYTGRPPLMLSDGANPIGKTASKADGHKVPFFEVPEGSVAVIRASGLGNMPLTVAFPLSDPNQQKSLAADEKSRSDSLQEIRYEVKEPATLVVSAGGNEIASWEFGVIPDNPPEIALTKKIEQTLRGALKLTYEVKDDYGVAGAELKLEKVPPKPTDPAMAWAAPKPLSGPRPPLERPPQIPLRLPAANTKKGEATSFLELSQHPWAGMRVRMTLVAKDAAGKTGKTETMEVILPERQFKKPLARAVVEQRRKLIDDPRYRDEVRTALAALTLAPEGFIDDSRVYLGLRSIFYRLANDHSRAGMKATVEQLWHIALRIEDGNLSEAEQRLRDAQDKLAKAIEEGASEEEIAKLMQELKQAFNDYAREMAEKNKENQDDADNGADKNAEQLSQEELDQMMKDLEEMAKSGSREEAMKMLSEMQDMMERMQKGQSSRRQAEENKEIMKMGEELSELLGEQQQLMDDTFAEQRAGEEGEDGQEKGGQAGKQDRMGQQGGKKGQKGQRGQNQPGQQGQSGEEGDESGSLGDGNEQGRQGKGKGKLGERQKGLKDRLSELKEKMREKRAGSPDKLDRAGESMRNAERSLEEGDLSDALENQAQALNEMRKTAEQLAEQMAANSPQKNGRKGDSRDPLGRPQKTQGPDLGTSVKVPSEIDRQRAREILEELRRRLGEATRPANELDYLERLEKRF